MMKCLLLTAVTLSSAFATLAPSSVFANPSQDADLLRRSLENRCRESWCQGAYSVLFRKIILDPLRKETAVQLTLRHATELSTVDAGPNFTAQLDQESFGATCRIKNVGSLAESLDPTTQEILPAFDEAMQACLQSLSSRINRLID